MTNPFAAISVVIDDFLTGGIVSRVDWVRMGSAHRFEFEPTTQWTGHNVELLLRQYGIRIGGRTKAWMDEDGRVRSAFYVRTHQAEHTEYILLSYDVSVLSPMLNPANLR